MNQISSKLFIPSSFHVWTTVILCTPASPKKSIHSLQLVQNAAARLLTGTRKYDHITPVLASLHWLPIDYRINFKILLFTYKARLGQAPAYICDLLSPYVPTRDLRSSNQALLDFPKGKFTAKGHMAFAIKAPTLWNALPLEIRLAESIPRFKSLLKTHFYRSAFILHST